MTISDDMCDTGRFPLRRLTMFSSSGEAKQSASGAAVCSLLSGGLLPSNNPNVGIDRWRKVRLFLTAVIAEPEFILYSGCVLIGACACAYCRRVEMRVAPSLIHGLCVSSSLSFWCGQRRTDSGF